MSGVKDVDGDFGLITVILNLIKSKPSFIFLDFLLCSDE
jgi:hypothetical protein